MESKAGYIMLLIDAIIHLVIGGVAVIVVLIITMGFFSSGNFTKSGILSALIIFILFMVFLAIGVLKLWSSKLMKQSRTVLKGGIIAVVLGVIIFDPLALIGGIIGIVHSQQK